MTRRRLILDGDGDALRRHDRDYGRFEGRSCLGVGAHCAWVRSLDAAARAAHDTAWDRLGRCATPWAAVAPETTFAVVGSRAGAKNDR